MREPNKCPKCGRAGRQRANGSYRCRYDGTVWNLPKAKSVTRKSSWPKKVQELSRELGEAHKRLQELRRQKKAGKDVKAQIRETLKFLAEGRAKKKRWLSQE